MATHYSMVHARKASDTSGALFLQRNIIMTLQNPFTDTYDNYQIVYKIEKLKVRGVKVEFKARYLQDSKGELWGDFKHPMENVYRAFDAYRHKMNLFSPHEICKLQKDLALSDQEFAKKLDIDTKYLLLVKHGHVLQTPALDLKLKEFIKHQVDQGLLKSGHITKKEYDYLEKEDQKDENK